MADNNTTPTKSFSWVIYVLKNPRTLEIRYVGWTRKKPGDRLKTHVWDSVRHPHQTYRQAWIMSLVSIGLTPIIEVIESGTGEGWGEAERKWIARYRAQGARLVNGTDGGDGVPGWGTPEQRSAIRKAVHAQRTPEERSVVGNNLDLSWPADRKGWRLQVQTNSLNNGLGNLWFDWPNSTNVTSASIPLNPANPSVFLRMVYP